MRGIQFVIAASFGLATLGCGTSNFNDLDGVPTGIEDGDDDALASLQCADGEIPVSEGSVWVCGTASDSTLTEEQVDDFVANNDYVTASSLHAVATSGLFTDLAQIPAGLADGDDDTLAGLTCAIGERVRSTTTGWECAETLQLKSLFVQVHAYEANQPWTWCVNGVCRYATTGGSVFGQAPVSLPAGTIITDITCFYWDNSATGSINGGYNAVVGGSGTSAGVFSSGADPEDTIWRSSTASANLTLAANQFVNLYFHISAADSNVRFQGCRVDYLPVIQ